MKLSEGYVAACEALESYGGAKFAELCGCPPWPKSGELDPDTLEMVNATCPTCGAVKTWPVDKELKARLVEQRESMNVTMRALGASMAATLDDLLVALIVKKC